MKYKLLVLDVDGTLLNSNKEITARTQGCFTESTADGNTY